MSQALKPTDFKVYEDGVEVPSAAMVDFGFQESPYAAVVLFDSSGSMEARFSLARSAAIRFLDGLREEDVAAVYRFDSSVERVQEFSGGRDLAPIGYAVRAKGMTTLNDAIVQAAKSTCGPSRDYEELLSFFLMEWIRLVRRLQAKGSGECTQRGCEHLCGGYVSSGHSWFRQSSECHAAKRLFAKEPADDLSQLPAARHCVTRLLE